VKKFLSIVLATIYLAVSSGVVVSVHYCMGEVAGIGIGHAEADRCGDCGMDNDGCCHDDVKVYKISDSHASAASHYDPVKAESWVALLSPPHDVSSPNLRLLPALVSADPPEPDGRSLCIWNCVFRI